MLYTKFFTVLSDSQIRSLRGGRKNKYFYFIGILNHRGGEPLTHVLRTSLLNQMGTQRTRAGYPAGYEPFETCCGERWFSLAAATFPIPRLIMAAGKPLIRYEHQPACILRAPPKSEQRFMLREAAGRFGLEHEVRVAAATGSVELSVAVDLLRPSRERAVARHISEDMAECLEAYLCLAETARLRDLLALLKMRGTGGSGSAGNPTAGLFLVA